ncbi:MAG: preprotein translocase subunit YajC [bacterium]|nr:preprotein translocase subunit YajC [bacterium]
MKKLATILAMVLGATNMFAMGAPATGTPQKGSSLMTMVPLILIMVIFYFLILFPQRQQQKKLMEMIKNVKNGDKIVTSGGIHGTVIKIDKTTITIQISSSPKAEMTIEKSVIGKVIQ